MARKPGTTSSQPPLAGREIIVGVCGGIAAYKVADVVSKLVQQGAGITVCMSREASEFITPLTFQALSARPVHTDMFSLLDSADPQHISLTEQADLMLIAPATSNLIAKVATGLCDDLLSLMIAASACPVVFAPAMNNRMWDNPICQRNIATLKKSGYRFIGPEAGWLACRNVGSGRLSQPMTIVDEVIALLSAASRAPKAKPHS